MWFCRKSGAPEKDVRKRGKRGRERERERERENRKHGRTDQNEGFVCSRTGRGYSVVVLGANFGHKRRNINQIGAGALATAPTNQI